MITSLSFFTNNELTIFAVAMLLALLTGIYGNVVTWALKTKTRVAAWIGYGGYVPMIIFGIILTVVAIMHLPDWGAFELISGMSAQIVLCLSAAHAFFVYTFLAFRDLYYHMEVHDL